MTTGTPPSNICAFFCFLTLAGSFNHRAETSDDDWRAREIVWILNYNLTIFGYLYCKCHSHSRSNMMLGGRMIETRFPCCFQVDERVLPVKFLLLCDLIKCSVIIIIIHNLYSAALLKDPAALYNNDNVNIKSVR